MSPTAAIKVNCYVLNYNTALPLLQFDIYETGSKIGGVLFPQAMYVNMEE